ncbi:MAG: VanZ family protein [Candidatus Auribacterota bacterium]
MRNKEKIYFRLTIAYFCFITYACMVPFNISWSPHALLEQVQGIRWIPYFSNGRRESLTDIVSNLAWFMPLGFFIAGSINRVASAALKLLIVLCSGAAVSLFHEILQLLTPIRVSSVTDLINNSLSAFAGGCVYVVYDKKFSVKVKVFLLDELKKPIIHIIMMLVLTFICVWALIPFDISIDIGTLKEGVKQFLRSLTFAQTPDSVKGSIQNYMLFSIAGFTIFVDYGSRRMYGLSRMALFWLISAGIVALELGKIAVVSQHSSLSAVLAGQAGLLHGMAWAYMHPDEARPQATLARLLIICYPLMLASEYLYPYRFAVQVRESVSLSGLLPFYQYFIDMNIMNIKDLLTQIFLFMPLGVMPIYKHNGSVQAFITGVTAGCIFELPQVFIEGRYIDSTDILTAGIGCALGRYALLNFLNFRKKLVNT